MRYYCQMLAAFVSAMLVANGLCYFYFNPGSVITNYDGYTVHKYRPSELTFYGAEGYCIKKTDRYGFYNSGDVTPNNANVVCIGSSQTEALQVSEDKNYVEKLMQLGSANLSIYNLGISGQFMNKSLSRLPRIPKYFPMVQAIVLETPNLPSVQDWQDMKKSLDTGEVVIEDQDWKDSNIVLKTIRKIPLLRLLRKQCLALNKKTEEKKKEKQKDINVNEYQFWANETLSALRNRMGNMKIVFVCLPHTKLQKTGDMVLQDEEDQIMIMKKACVANNIKYVDMWPAFHQAYENERIVPYGHVNGHAASGHLNAHGHRIIAETLYDVFKKDGLCQ